MQFIVPDDLKNATFGNDSHHDEFEEEDKTDPYPTGYEILRCLFIPLFVYIVNRILHGIMSKSIKYIFMVKSHYL